MSVKTLELREPPCEIFTERLLSAWQKRQRHSVSVILFCQTALALVVGLFGRLIGRIASWLLCGLSCGLGFHIHWLLCALSCGLGFRIH